MICKHCKNEFSDELNFCPKCNEPVKKDSDLGEENQKENSADTNREACDTEQKDEVFTPHFDDESTDKEDEYSEKTDIDPDAESLSSDIAPKRDIDDGMNVFSSFDPSQMDIKAKNDRKKTRNTFLSIALIAVVSVVIILGVVLVKNYITEHSPAKAVERYVLATYNFEIDNYVKYSTINEECQKLLGNTDYDFDETYNSMKNDFSDLKSYTLSSFDDYEVEIDIDDEDIYEKGSKKFDECLEDNKKLYTTDENIEAFAKVEAELTVKYTYNGENGEEENELNLNCIKVGNVWYIID